MVGYYISNDFFSVLRALLHFVMRKRRSLRADSESNEKFLLLLLENLEKCRVW